MRINVNNSRLPGVQSEFIPTPSIGVAGELSRAVVYDIDGAEAGHIVYVRRPLKGRRGRGSEYGWQPVGIGARSLGTKTEAVERLLDVKRGAA